MLATEVSPDQQHCRVVIRPNRSLSWRESLVFLVAIGIVLVAVSGAFALRGYWIILPFAGLELLALAYCTHRVAAASYRCEVVSIDPAEVVVERGRQRQLATGRGGPEFRHAFPRAWTKVELREQAGWYPDRVLIGASGQFVELGSFLVDTEKRQLAAALQQQLAGLDAK